MKRSYQAASDASGADSNGRQKRPRLNDSQQKQQRPPSPENPYRIVEVSSSRYADDLPRGGSLTDLTSMADNSAGSSDSFAVIVPRCAAWFDYNRVHRVERLAFPQFFNNSDCPGRTPETYVAYRNYMIDSYRANPANYYSLASCSRDLPGDIRALASVHAFLEQWGLINLQAGGEFADSTVPFHLLRQVSDKEGELEPAEAPEVEQFLKIEQQPLRPAEERRRAAEQERSRQSNLNWRQPVGLRVDQYCGADYKSSRRNDWSDAELLALLEGVELYKDDWSRVADRVGPSRTQEECIMQMLKLPIMDPYLEGAEQVLGPLASKLVPFGEAANPVMCTVAFLASAVDARVASAGALAALTEYGKFSAKQEDEAAALKEAAGGICDTVLQAAADKSEQLSQVELCKMRALTLQLIEMQMKKIEVRLRHYQELDASVEKEREICDTQMDQIFLERRSLHQELVRAAELAAGYASDTGHQFV